MPYLGLLNDDRVIPPQVADNTTVVCPVCDGSMSVIDSYERSSGTFVSRHFRHCNREKRSEFQTTKDQATFADLKKIGKCPGESDEHLKMKSIAYARLEHDFPNSTVELESGIEGRIADVLVTFNEPYAPYGNGIAVEVQYRNQGKDIEKVTDHYLERGYSVVWLEESDFSAHDVDLSGILTVWPYVLPARSGLDGYSDIIRWLWQDKSAAVVLGIPIPSEYWASFDKSGEWVTVAQCYLRRRGRAWVTISRSPDGHFTFQLGKKEWGWNADTHRVTVQLTRDDCTTLRRFTKTLQRKGFDREYPSKDDRDEPWYDLTTVWFAGSPTITAWLSASLSPDDDVVISLWKKHPKETERVSVQVDNTATRSLYQIADLVEQAFELESS